MRYLYVRSKIGCQRGAVAVTVAILLFVFFGFAALSIDIGYLMTTRNELQNVADAAALAAARQMGVNYTNMVYAEQLNYDCESNHFDYPCSQIVDVAQEVGRDNVAAQVNIEIDGVNDIEIGRWSVGATPPFTPGTAQPNAVRVTARRDETSNGSITTFLAGVIGVDTLSVTAQATAALTGPGSVEEGDLELPIGISEYWITQERENPEDSFCNQPITFSPSNSPNSCAGWTSWKDTANDHVIGQILDPLENPTLSPALSTGDEIEFIGGDLSKNTFKALDTLFQSRGYDVKKGENDEWVPAGGYDHDREPNPGPVDPPPGMPICEKNADDPDDPDEPKGINYHLCDETHTTHLLYPDESEKNKHWWDTKVVIYASDSCENPNQTKEIVGFAEIRLTEVQNAPFKSVVGHILCEKKDSGVLRGGGGEYGTYGSIPGLVQ